MITRPFSITYQHHTEPGMLEVKVAFKEALPSDSKHLNALLFPMEAFCKVGFLGGFSGDTISPMKSTMELEDARLVGTNEYRWLFKNVKADPGILFVLVNVFHRMHIRYSMLDGIRIISNIVKNQEAPIQEIPLSYSPSPFEITYNAGSSEILIEVEFENDQGESVLKEFEDAFDSWLAIAVSGGFADEDHLPGQTSIYPADDPRSFPDGIMFPLDDVYIADQAYDCLENIFYKLHFKVARIASLLIY